MTNTKNNSVLRLLSFLILLLIPVWQVSAQVDPNPPSAEPVEKVAMEEMEIEKVKKKIPIHFQIGINAPLLIGGFLGGGSEAVNTNPYLLNGKFMLGKIALRVGGGGNLQRVVEREGEFADSRTVEDMGFDLRIGLEWQQEFGKRWIGTFGADGILFSSKENVILDTGFDAVTTGTFTQGWGFGPVLGLKFAITKRLSILTEGAFYYTESSAQTSRLFKNFPDFDDELGSIESTELRINLPATFFIQYQF